MPLYQEDINGYEERFMHSTLIQAITEKRLIQLRYHSYSRIVEPHAYGRNNLGNHVLRCYQTEGGSLSGENIGWKLLKTSEILSLCIMDECFIIRRDYKRNDEAMIYIFGQVEK